MALFTFAFLVIVSGPATAQNDKSTSARLAKLEEYVAGLMTQMSALQGKVATLENAVLSLQGELSAAENRIAVLETNQGGGTPIIWSGGSSQYGVGTTGWIRYLTDMEDFNTAAGYLTVNANGIITVLKPGFFRINFRTISFGLGFFNIQIRKNGQAINFGQINGGLYWIDNLTDVTYQFNAGDTIEVYVNNPTSTSYAYYSWSATNSSSRLQVQYEGALQPTL